MNSDYQRHHWNSVSGNWAYLGPPLKPIPADLETMLDAIGRYHGPGTGEPFRAAMWGVTPELASMAWPQGTQLVAIDRAEQMIESVWPGDVAGFRKAVLGEWADSPRILGEAQDLLIGDGSLINARYPSEYSELTQAAGKCLRQQGLFIMRLHAKPDSDECVEKVVEDLMNLAIGNFHIFKFRLAMALQDSAEEGVEIGSIWERWNGLGIDEHRLAETTGWDLNVIRTIHMYKGKKGRYTFPTLAQHLDVFERGLVLREVHIPPYEMGERRPIVVLSRP